MDRSTRGRTSAVAAGIFLVSLSVLMYEIALTRVFSVILTYHYVFLIVSTALLGLSFGGVFAYFRGGGPDRPETPLSLWAALDALAMSASIFLLNQLGRTELLFLLVGVSLLPFFFAGVTLAAAFRRYADRSSPLYAADLIGAAMGAVAVVRALNALGGPDSILAAAVIAAGGSLLLAFERPATLRQVGGALAALAVTGVLFAVDLRRPLTGEVPIGRDPNKDLYRILSNPSMGAKIVETRWSAFGRTDLVRREGDADMMDLFIDGAAGTAMYRWSGSLEDTTGAVQMLRHHFTGMFPFQYMEESQKDNALIIGPGGGRDVLVNLLAGVREITAVEVNPDFVAMVRKYADYNGGIYTRVKNVRVVVDEGRNFLKRSREKYDVIMLTLPVTKSSRSYEGYALTESFLFTRESFRDYLDHLTPEGSLIVVNHGFLESIKLLTTALSAFQDMGKTAPEAMKQMYVLGSRMMPVFVVQGAPLDSARASLLHEGLHLAGFEGQGSYVPHVKQVILRRRFYEDDDVEWPMMNQNMIDLAEGKVGLRDLIRAAPFDVGPATDNRPFFFKFEPGIPGVLVVLLGLSALFLFAVMGFPALTVSPRAHGDGLGNALPWVIPFLFAGIGVGFMLVEVTLFQKLVLYLGQPTFALALLLFSLLTGAGLGSFASGRVRTRRLADAIWVSALGVTGAVAVASGLLAPVFDRLLKAGSPPVAGAAGLLIGLGFILGFPFPLGIRLMKQSGMEEDIPWVWGINGAASVFGSALAVVVAISLGYSAALALGGLVYLGVAFAIRGSRQRLAHSATCGTERPDVQQDRPS